MRQRPVAVSVLGPDGSATAVRPRERVQHFAPWHLLPIGVLLLASSFFVGHGGYVFIDEAALFAQAELVAEGSWTVERPLADVDPSGAYAPMARSRLTDDGFAPFPNHPLHVLLAATASDLGGRTGIRLLSVAGTLGAVAAAGYLAASVGRRESSAAMWIAGAASPLLFHSNLVVAHTLGASAAGAVLVTAFMLSARADSRGRSFVVALSVGLLVAVGALLRSEVLLMGVAIGVVCALNGMRRRRWVELVVAAGATVGTVVAYVLEPWWIAQIAGSSPGGKTIEASARAGARGALQGAQSVLFGLGRAGPALPAAVLLAVAGVVVIRLRPRVAGPGVLLAATALVAAVVHVTGPAIVPGIFFAFPLLTIGMVGLSRGHGWTRPVVSSSQAVLLFAAMVLATQYAVGGGVEWGWRYFGVALPAVSAALAVPVVALVRHSHGHGRVALAGALIVAVLVPVSGLLAQRNAISRVERLLESADALFAKVDADVIVAADPSFGRYAWGRSIAGEVVTAPNGAASIDLLLERLADQGATRILLVWVGDEPTIRRDRAAAQGEVVVLLPGAYAARPYELAPNTRSPS